MKKLFEISLSAMTLLIISLSTVHAQSFEITITNLTRGQIFSPVLAVTHSRGQTLFTSGEAATSELAALAQDANADGLTALLSSTAGVNEIVHGTGVILPGKSETLLIHSNFRARYFSLVSMLVTTNDAFMAVNRVKLPRRFSMISVPAYDAGAEDNDESCAYIPGPPCGNANAASEEAGEGFVHIHSGIHGVGDLSAAKHDWRNPVAKISIRRIRSY